METPHDGTTEKPLENITRLSRDLRIAAETLTPDEARFLVDAYYILQRDRIRSEHQVRALAGNREPCSVLVWLSEQSAVMETQVKGALDRYSLAHPVGAWMREIPGVGPVIAAGMLGHIDIEKAPTAGHIWRFAGLDPTQKWEKKTKRPWNADLKTLCWKLGESFVKVKANDDDIYGKIYEKRKALEWQRNMAGDFADQAAAVLKNKRIGKDTHAFKWYSGDFIGADLDVSPGKPIKGIPAGEEVEIEEGGKDAARGGRRFVPRPGTGIKMLPPDHIHSRAKRYAVKLFLSHLHEIWYRIHFKKAPPLPYPIAVLGHAHKIEPGALIAPNSRSEPTLPRGPQPQSEPRN